VVTVKPIAATAANANANLRIEFTSLISQQFACRCCVSHGVRRAFVLLVTGLSADPSVAPVHVLRLKTSVPFGLSQKASASIRARMGSAVVLISSTTIIGPMDDFVSKMILRSCYRVQGGAVAPTGSEVPAVSLRQKARNLTSD
jgi:hypothetical protein